jgi:hypothetical protein
MRRIGYIGVITSIFSLIFLSLHKIDTNKLSYSGLGEFQKGPYAGIKNLKIEYDIQSPKKLFLNQDGELRIKIKSLCYADLKFTESNRTDMITKEIPPEDNLTSNKVKIEIFSHSFKLAPKPSEILSLKEGESALFILSPLKIGKRKLVINSNIINQIGEAKPIKSDLIVITINISEKSIFGFLSAATIRNLSYLASIIGIPSLLGIILSRIFERRKKKKEKNKPLIIIK